MKRIPHQLTENTKLLQKVAIWHQNEVLILQRAKDAASRPEKWDLPGGNSEWPEASQQSAGSLHQADAAREVKEETGITVLAEGFDFSSLVYFDTYYSQEKEVFTVICGWRLELPEDFDRKMVEISDEHIEAKWIKIEELGDHDFDVRGEFVKNIIRKSK